jgi:hypothetical protein
MITEDQQFHNDSSSQPDIDEGVGAAGVLPNLTFPAVPSHNISTYRTYNASGFFDKPIVDKSINGPSKILTRKWRDHDMNLHRRKLAEIKATTKNLPNTS